MTRSLAVIKRNCVSCGCRTLQMAGTRNGKPVWECLCCYAETRRNQPKVMKSNPELDRLFEDLSK